jgi:hypothetical protein
LGFDRTIGCRGERDDASGALGHGRGRRGQGRRRPAGRRRLPGRHPDARHHPVGRRVARTGAAVETDAERITATWADCSAVFSRDADGIWSAHFDGTDQQRATEKVSEVDTAYGRLVQRTVLDRLREQAPSAGLRLTSETVDDTDAVHLVFEVERERS